MAKTKYGILLTCIIHSFIALALGSSSKFEEPTSDEPTLCSDKSCGKDCSPEQCKQACLDSNNRQPEFLHLSYAFEVGPPPSTASDNIIGSVEAEDPDDATTSCGKVQYFASLELSPIPLQLDEVTGEIRVTNWEGFDSWPETYEFNVTAHNPGQLSFTASTATVTLTRRNRNDQDPNSVTPHELRRSKRTSVSAPTEITFSMTKTGDAAASEMCIGCSWTVQIVLGLPSGTQAPTVELFGASDDTTAHGYVRNVVLIRKGARITSDVVISTNAITENPNFGVTHMGVNLGSITVDGTAGASAEDFQIVLQYEMGLAPSTTATASTKLTGGAGALLSETLWIGVLNVQVITRIDPEITITNCPATVNPGDVFALDVTTYLPYASGDYEIEVNSITPAVSIQHVALQPGAGFTSDLNMSQTRIIDVQDSLVLGKTIRTNIYGTTNSYASDTSQKAESGIQVTAYVQVSPFAATRSSVSIYFHMPSGTSEMRTCYSDIILNTADFTQVVAQLAAPTTGADTETEKMVNTDFRIIIPPNSKQAYSVITEVGNVLGAELGYVTVTSGIANIPAGLQLLSSFTRSGDDHLLLKAQTYIGTIQNTRAVDSELTLRMNVKLRTNDQVAVSTPIPLTARLHWEGGEQPPHSFSITSTGKSTPTAAPIPTNKVPEVTIEKFQPANENPTAKYATVLRMKAKFASDTVYMPVTFRIEFNSNDVTLLDSRFESIDPCLESIIPVGLSFTPNGNNAYELQIPSVYVACNIVPQEGWVTFRFVVSTPTTNAYKATAKVLVNTLEYSHFVDITLLAFNTPTVLTGADLPMVDVQNARMETPKPDSFIYPAVNLLFSTVTIQPGAKEIYELQISSSNTANGQFCHPRLLNFDSKIGFEPKEFSEASGTTKTELGYVFYQDTSIDSTLGTVFGRHTISYVLPLRMLTNQQADATVNIQHGAKFLTKTFNLPANPVQITPTKSATVQSGKLELFDFSPRSTYSVTESVAPGEPIKFYYTIQILETKCATYEIIVSNPTDATWPVELSGIYLQSYGASIWCLDAIPTFTTQKSTSFPVVNTRLDMNLGTICSHGTTDSWVRLLIYARPWWNPSDKASITTTIARSLNVQMKEDSVLNPQAAAALQFTVDPARTMTYLPSKSSTSASISFDTATVEASPGKTATVTFKIHVPPAAKYPDSSITVQCEAKGNPSQSGCSIIQLNLISGTDLASITNEPFIPSITSTVDSGQLNQAVLEFGNLVHTGLDQSVRVNLQDAGVLTAQAEVKLADSADANHDANIPLKVMVKLDSQTISKSVDLRVKRTGAETMEVDLVSELLDSAAASTFNPGDSFQIRVNRTMSATSQLECQEQTLQIHNGKIFTNVFIVDQSPGLPEFQPNPSLNDPRITEFKAGGFFFDQSAWITFSITVVPDLLISGGKLSLNSALVIELICMANQRTNPVPVDGVGGRPARFVTIQQIPVGKPGSCMKDLELSDATKILDCQITSFSSADPNHRAPNIRYTSSVGWKPPVRSGEFARYRYIDILFGKMATVKEIKVKLISDANKVIKIDIYGTNDGRAYFFHEQSQVTYADNLHGSIWLTSELQSRGLRLVVSEQQNEDEEVTFTIDLWGCDDIVDNKAFDPCNVAPHSLAAKGGFLPQPFIVQPRVFLYAGGHFFFCDLILDPFVTFSRRKRCYHAEDTPPIRWYDMGPTVSQVLTYLPTEKIIFGIGSDGQSLVQSSDFGKRWLVINRSAYHVQVVGAASSVNATAVPWSIIRGKFDAATTGTSCTAYTGGSWYICYGGIYQNTKLLLDWNTKCPTFNPPRI